MFAVGQTVALHPDSVQYRRGARTAVVREVSTAKMKDYAKDIVVMTTAYYVKLDKAVSGRALWWIPQSSLQEVDK
jgi:hypothetical protein